LGTLSSPIAIFPFKGMYGKYIIGCKCLKGGVYY
jgi:hypothetical protein